MRLEKAAGIVALARQMASTSEGVSIEEIARDHGVTRRTAERMRDMIRELFPQTEELVEGRSKRYRIRGGLDGFVLAPSPDELAELNVTIRSIESVGGDAKAALLRSLASKIQSALRAPVRLKIEPDLEALAVAEGFVMQAGPRPRADATTLGGLREAIKSSKTCRFDYKGGSDPKARLRHVEPYGILYGRSYYLVAPEVGRVVPKLWRFDRMSRLTVGTPFAGPPLEFDLAEFASRSFGTFQEAPENIALRFSSVVAADAGRFMFHPTQRFERGSDGSLTVRFRSGGFQELAQHLFAWTDQVEIVSPESLRVIMVEQLHATLAKHEHHSQSGNRLDLTVDA